MLMRLLVVASILSLTNAYGAWRAVCNPTTVTTDCGPNFQQCGPWAGEDDSWTDNRCYCIPGQDNNCCHGLNACKTQHAFCQPNSLVSAISNLLSGTQVAQCDTDAHQCRSTCVTLGQAAGLIGAAGTVVNINANGDNVNALGLVVSVTGKEKKALQTELAYINNQIANGDPLWTATDGTAGAGKKVSPSIQGAEVNNGNGSEIMLPVSSSVALIFLAFFVGIILAYVIYKINKRRTSQTKYDVQGLGDSARQALDGRSPRSSTEV